MEIEMVVECSRHKQKRGSRRSRIEVEEAKEMQKRIGFRRTCRHVKK